MIITIYIDKKISKISKSNQICMYYSTIRAPVGANKCEQSQKVIRYACIIAI